LQTSRVTFTEDPEGTGTSNVDSCGHGTHVTGTLSALDNTLGIVGINRSGNLSLKIVKVFDGKSCSWSYSSTLVKALDTCRSGVTGKLVVNMSLGGTAATTFERLAFDQAYAAGVLSVAAAGNAGNSQYSYPASYASVVSVGALDASKTIASFSQSNAQVDLAAPGVAVLSTVPWVTRATVTVGTTTIAGNPIEYAPTSSGVSGVLVDGGLCDAPMSVADRIVLCDRGTVSFYTKVRNAELGGARGVVIANNVAGALVGSLGAGNTSAIPAIGVTQSDGAYLRANGLGSVATLVNETVAPASGYESWDGTSMATPHVSGVAARIWNLVPNATNAHVRQALTDTAEDLGTPGRDDRYGYGLVRAKAALDRLRVLAGGGTCTPSPEVCTDGLDNDCDGAIDGLDPDCRPVTCGAKGTACTKPSDCCSANCKGKAGAKRCQ
jgi:subtilisin family serine protease